jgi:nucleotide-binding universal stress UspA family protein
MTYLSQETLEVSSSIAVRTGAQLYLLRAVDSITELGEQWKTLSESVAEEARTQTQVFEVLKKGSAAERITDWASKHQVDLIVLGANHRPFLNFTTLGTTTEKVMRHSDCSVLVVPNRRRTEVKESVKQKRTAIWDQMEIDELRAGAMKAIR